MFVNEENEVEYLHITKETNFLITVKTVPQTGKEDIYFIWFTIFPMNSPIRIGVYTTKEKAHNAIEDFMAAFTEGESSFTFKKEA